MIKIETITIANLSKAIPGERFTFKAQPYTVERIDRYTNDAGQERMAVTLQTYCHECGAAFEFTTNRRPKWLKKSCGRDHAPRPVHTKPTRQNATSSQGDAIQAETPEVKRYSPTASFGTDVPDIGKSKTVTRSNAYRTT